MANTEWYTRESTQEKYTPPSGTTVQKEAPFVSRLSAAARSRNGVSVFLASQEPVASIICACSHTCNRPVSVRATTTSPVPLWLAHTSKPTNRESPLKPGGNQMKGKIDGDGRWRMEEEGKGMREDEEGEKRNDAGGRREEGGRRGGGGTRERGECGREGMRRDTGRR